MTHITKLNNLFKNEKDFLGGPVVKNPPVNAEDTGSIPGLEDSTCNRATKAMHHNWAWAPRACALQQGSHHSEKTTYHN